MSHNQSKGDKNKPPQYRRSGRSGNPAPQRSFSSVAGGGDGKGGGNSAPPPPPSSQPANRGGKNANNAQGGQPRTSGSIVPFDVLQIPARTYSAPPNLDEQKRDQARHASLRGANSTFPTPTVPKQQLPKKDAGTEDQSKIITEPHQMPKAKRDVHVPVPPSVAQTQKPSGHPIPGISMPMPFHQPQIPVQFGGPNSQMQSQAMVNSSMPMPIPIPLPMGNPPQVQQQVFVPGIQPHPMQPQGMMHQGQSLNFSAQMGPPLAPQLGNMGMSLGTGTQYHHQQQAGKYGGARKTVKITHPDTHEELRLDRTIAYGESGPSIQRSRPNIAPQSQPIPSYPHAHPMNYYPNSYNAPPVYFPAPVSVPLASSQIPSSSQAPPRIHNQVTVKPAPSLHGEKVGDSSLLPVIDKSEFPKISRPRGEASSAIPQRDSTSTAMPPGSKSTTTGSVSVPETTDGDGMEVNSSGLTSPSSLSSKDKSVPELNRLKSIAKGKKKKKEMLQKAIPEDWEDAADISTPKLVTLHNGKKVPHGLKVHDEDEIEGTKKYSRDFPLKLSELCNELPEGFEITSFHKDKSVPELNRAKSIARGKKKEKEMLQKAIPEDWEDAADISTPKLVNLHNGKKVPHGLKVHDEDEIEGTKKYSRDFLLKFSELCNELPEGFEITSFHKGWIPSPQTPLQVMHKAERKFVVGNIRLIGEFYKKRMLTEIIMHECIKKLLGEYQNPDEEDVEALCKLMSTIGEMIDHPKAKEYMDAYFDMMNKLSNNMKLSSRVRFMLKDSIDLRKNKWQQRMKVEGPKKIDEVYRDAAQERQAQSSRAKSTIARGKNKKKEMLQKADAQGTTSDLYMVYKGPEEKREALASNDSTESSSSITSKQVSADVSKVDVSSNEKRDPNKPEPEDWEDAADISTPKLVTLHNGKKIPHGLKVHDEDEIEETKKYSRDFLMKLSELCNELPEGFEITSLHKDKSVPELNRAKSTIARGKKKKKEMLQKADAQGTTSDLYKSTYDHLSQQERNMHYMNRDTRNVDHTFDRPPPASPPTRGRGQCLSHTQNQVLPEERLREKSIEAIKEFYSAKDEKEVALCITELNAPSFYPSMISIWVNDSFERKDLERDLLAMLLVNLAKSHDAMLNQDQLVRGFESVLASLEDTVIDAPKAAEFLGRILARVLLENAIPYVDVWRLIHEGGEEQGRLVEVGLAAEVVGVILEIIKSERGDPFLTEMCNELPEGFEITSFHKDKSVPELNRAKSTIARGKKKKKEMLQKADAQGTTSDLYKSTYYHLSQQERNMHYMNRDTRNVDHTFDRPPPASPPTRGRGQSLSHTQNQVLPEERLREKSIEAIKEFYSARDEKEVALCITELNAPSFYPSMISIWVNDSFERKDLERDLLAMLLVNLAKSHDAMLNQDQLVRGFESVLASLEDTVIDAPKAAEFLGRILARVLLESAIPYVDVWRLIHEGGEEQGRLVEVGLAAEVVGVILEIIKSERGDPFLTEMCNELPEGFEITSFHMDKSVPELNRAKRTIARGKKKKKEMLQKADAQGTTSDHYKSTYDHLSQQERNMHYMNRDTRNVDHTFDRPPPASPPTRGRGQSLSHTQNQVLPEERLRKKSIEAIKEFYSARDEKEVALCITELNAPSFYPSMISIWVNDSFERKDLERDLLAMLLVNLAKSHDAMLNQDQLVRGFESVLASLEDTVIDAPKAAEFLGRILARVLLESAIPYVDVWRLIHEGGEEQGRLVEVGLAAEVVGVILEIIKSERGDPFLTEMCNELPEGFEITSFHMDKSVPELNRAKRTIARGKKKKKEMLQKADAQGTTSDHYKSTYDHLSQQERNMHYMNRDTRNVDHTFDRPPPASPPTRGRGQSLSHTQNQVLPEERLRKKSIEAIKEFYSARDEKEVALCITELNAPSFYPSMISIWVNDSFERKDLERDLLAMLLVNLAKSHDAMLNQDQLVRGFESVLASLEDTVIDAPKAAEFLGRILARVLLESAIPYVDVWRLIHEGGEEQGRLVEVGLAAEVVGVILEIIKSERGDPFLTEMCNELPEGFEITSFHMDKSVPELNRAKRTIARGKKKKKEMLQKADAQGTTSDHYKSTYDHLSQQERNMHYMNRDTRNVDHTFDRPPPASPPTRGRGQSLSHTQNQVLPEERLRKKSIEAIKEFYSTRDEKEVAVCITELNAPSFYPSMISIWVNDSFERKDLERDLLAMLLVNLAKSHDAMLNQDQLVRGFESVLASLEDTVIDAPKAAEFLGRILARVVLESAIPYVDVWRLIHEGGEEQGRLVEVGLAAEVVGVILEIIKSERGDPFLTEICASSNLRVESFRPPGSKKSWRIDKFI